MNAILPGLIPTAIFGNGMGMNHEQSMRMADAMTEVVAPLQPLPRAGRPRDIADACLFLASDASAFITGTELRVDGGATLKPLNGDADLPGSMDNVIATAAKMAVV